jgi:hypothetical protein
VLSEPLATKLTPFNSRSYSYSISLKRPEVEFKAENYRKVHSFALTSLRYCLLSELVGVAADIFEQTEMKFGTSRENPVNLLGQTHPASIVQFAEQPSPSMLLPSSHYSLAGPFIPITGSVP